VARSDLGLVALKQKLSQALKNTTPQALHIADLAEKAALKQQLGRALISKNEATGNARQTPGLAEIVALKKKLGSALISKNEATGATRQTGDLAELIALKRKLGQALISKNGATEKPFHMLTAAETLHVVQNVPDVEQLSALKNKLHQALSSCRAGSMHQNHWQHLEAALAHFRHQGENSRQRFPRSHQQGRP